MRDCRPILLHIHTLINSDSQNDFVDNNNNNNISRNDSSSCSSVGGFGCIGSNCNKNNIKMTKSKTTFL